MKTYLKKILHILKSYVKLLIYDKILISQRISQILTKFYRQVHMAS